MCNKCFSFADIVREPSIFCTQHSVTPGENIDCTIHNYSVFIDLVIVKSDLIEFEKYPASHKCKPKVLDQVTAKCSIRLNDKGSFSICVNYSSSVSTHEILNECTNHIHVETLFSKCKFLTSYIPIKWLHLFLWTLTDKVWIFVVIAVLLLILVAVFVGCCYCHYKKGKTTSNRTDNEHAQNLGEYCQQEKLFLKGQLADAEVDKDSPKKRKKTTDNERAPLLGENCEKNLMLSLKGRQLADAKGEEVDKDAPRPMSSTRPSSTPTIPPSTSATSMLKAWRNVTSLFLHLYTQGTFQVMAPLQIGDQGVLHQKTHHEKNKFC